MIRTLDEVIHCDCTNTKRTDAGCLHCVWSAKIAELWLCMFEHCDNADEKGERREP